MFKLLFPLVQVVGFFLLVGYVYAKSPAYRLRRSEPLGPSQKMVLFGFFTGISIIGTYLGVPVHGALANARAIGPVLAGLIGGPAIGAGVGLLSGLHRWHLGGFTAVACGVSTTVEGLVGGLVSLYCRRSGAADRALDPATAGLTMLVAESLQMVIILLLAHPWSEALALVEVIALPMVLANSCGAALFMSILRDRRDVWDLAGNASTARTLRIADRTLDLLAQGFNAEVAPRLAVIIQEETGVGAVAITDRERVLAFTGVGSDHHKPGTPITSESTWRAIGGGEVVFLDGIRDPYRCSIQDGCPLGSVLVVPLLVGREVIGTLKLYEKRQKRFLSINRTLGEGLANLLASQLARAHFQEQQELRVRAELQLAHAQVNPHFLFNSLAAIQAIVRKDPQRARALLDHLADYFRRNLRHLPETCTLQEELDHVGAYLEIEKARFEDQLQVAVEVDPDLLGLRLPTFTLQPLVENAINHGIAEQLEGGRVRIRARREDGRVRIEVEDDAGAYDPAARNPGGLGMALVDRRIRNLLRGCAGLQVHCEPGRLTRVSIVLEGGPA
ncbi:sensor histidine kinase [Mesoterricola sediminis]|uniref:histidine kinase n=1 Tax=Mesoterricola sediminis TaxID=2927980 RepID=A0AA48HC47_9BACT|nr:sensor histidine kinase [Mesoterricola sediminis]BDU75573.1 sensor histidine kinase [Mesoterricola sediminis]